MRDIGIGYVVGVELDVISMSDEKEKFDVLPQGGDEVRRRREDVVARELAAHGVHGIET